MTKLQSIECFTEIELEIEADSFFSDILRQVGFTVGRHSYDYLRERATRARQTVARISTRKTIRDQHVGHTALLYSDELLSTPSESSTASEQQASSRRRWTEEALNSIDKSSLYLTLLAKPLHLDTLRVPHFCCKSSTISCNMDPAEIFKIVLVGQHHTHA